MVRRALESLPVSVSPAQEPHWELFHAHQLRKAIDECDLPTGKNYVYFILQSNALFLMCSSFFI